MRCFRKIQSYVILALVVVVGTGITLKATSTDRNKRGTFEHPIAIEKKKDIRVVYQFKKDVWKNEIGAPFHYLDKLSVFYEQRGVSKHQRRIHGVFQGQAAYMLLKDSAYRKERSNEMNNPNGEAIEALLQKGVRLEICASTMRNHGWSGEDIRPGIDVVSGAYPRVIDLQHRGYAYIRF